MQTFFGSMYEISSCYDRGFLIDEIMLYLIMYELFHDPYDEPQCNSGRKKWIELKEIVGELEGKWQGKGEISSSHLSNFYFLASNPPFIPFWTMLTCT